MELHLTFFDDCKSNILFSADLKNESGPVELDVKASSQDRAVHAACILLILAKARGPKFNQKYIAPKDGTFIETLAVKVKSGEYRDDFFKLFGMGKFLDGSRGTRKDGCGAYPHIELLTSICSPTNIFIRVRPRTKGRTRRLISIETLHDLALKLEHANHFWSGCKCVKAIKTQTIALRKTASQKKGKISTARIGNETSLQRWQRLLWYHVRRTGGETEAIHLLEKHSFSFHYYEWWNFSFPKTGDTPLLGAIGSNKKKLTEFLLGRCYHDVNIGIPNHFGQTPILRAASIDHDYKHLFNWVNSKHPDLNVKNKAGLGLMHELAFTGPWICDDAIFKFMEEGYSISEVTKDGFLPVSLAIERKATMFAVHQLLPQTPDLLSICDDRGRSLARIAFERGDYPFFVEFVELLEKHGIKWWKSGFDPYRRGGGASDLYSIIENYELEHLQRFLDKLIKGTEKYDVNEGLWLMAESPLHAAVRMRNLEAVKLLLGAGAYPLIYNHHGRIPRELLRPKVNEWNEKDFQICALLDSWEQKYITDEFDAMSLAEFQGRSD